LNRQRGGTTNFSGSFTVGKTSKKVKDFYAPLLVFLRAARNEIDRLGVIYLKLY